MTIARKVLALWPGSFGPLVAAVPGPARSPQPGKAIMAARWARKSGVRLAEPSAVGLPVPEPKLRCLGLRLDEFCQPAAGDGGLCGLEGADGWQAGGRWPQRLLGNIPGGCAYQRRERFPAHGAARP